MNLNLEYQNFISEQKEKGERNFKALTIICFCLIFIFFSFSPIISRLLVHVRFINQLMCGRRCMHLDYYFGLFSLSPVVSGG